ncbi:MAG: NADH-quinone oxidoreductase subunit N [Chloroflexota bacterium]
MDLILISPEIMLSVFALLLVGLDLALADERKGFFGYLAFAGVVCAGALVVGLADRSTESFSGALVIDPMAIFFKLLFLTAAGLVVLASIDYVPRSKLPPGEYFGLILFATVGLMFMASTRELISIYVSLELASISLYVLAGLVRNDAKSSEAAVKYMLLGALSSAALLYGMSLLYGLTGTTELDEIAQALGGQIQPALLMAVVFITAGFGFKIAAVPFHMWAPDVYQGAPTPVTAFLSVGSKAAGFAVLLRVFISALSPAQDIWSQVFAVLAVLTMTAGNLVALRQTNIKRMLAYSSIAQAGYAMTGLAAITGVTAASAGVASGLLVFLLAYMVTNLGAFIAVIAFFNQAGSDEVEDYGGLARRSPLLALGLAVCLASLGGMPPMVGFASKLYLFFGVYQQGLVWLVVAGVLNSAVSLYYYLRVVKVMYFKEPASITAVASSSSTRVAVAASVLAVFALGLYPAPFIQLATVAAKALLP